MGVSDMLNGVTAYYLTFISTVLSWPPELAGSLLMWSKLYDALCDVGVGMASDLKGTRWRRPYLLAGAIVSSLSFLILFAPPHLGAHSLVPYMIIGLLLEMSSGIEIPYVRSTDQSAYWRFAFGNDVRGAVAHWPNTCGVGNEFCYANANTQLLEWVVAAATGERTPRISRAGSGGRSVPAMRVYGSILRVEHHMLPASDSARLTAGRPVDYRLWAGQWPAACSRRVDR
jgi:hypothetical protein